MIRWLRPAAAALVAASAFTAPRVAGARPRWQELPEPAPLPVPAEQSDLSIDDFTLHYVVYGTGAPVVLLHGGLGSGEQFGNQVPVLAARFQVIVVDSRGQGRSTRSARPFRYAQMADDVLALLDHLAIRRAAIVGWSDGGVIGLDLALRHPERVDRLFVIGTNYDRSGLKPAGPSRTFARYYSRCTNTYRRLGRTLAEVAALRRDLRAMWSTQPRYTEHDLRAITVPTMVALGEHDEIIRREHAVRMAALIPGAEVHILPSVSHFAMWQDPDAFNQLLLAFLSR